MNKREMQSRPAPAQSEPPSGTDARVATHAATRPPAKEDPTGYPRRILLASLGLFPQVLTETLWCLARADPPFVPTEIHAVTTVEGRRRAELTLLDPSSAMLRALAADLGHPQLAEALTADRLHVIADGGGRPLADIDGPADNEAAADTIARLVARLTADPRAALHVSIAGGRKTMGFLVGYALSLHGRAQDRLSHVLVSEPFQSHPQFFFPPGEPRVLMARESRPVSTAEARVMLADIPFVRLRPALQPEFFAEGTSYSDLVAAMQRRFAPPHLVVDGPGGRLVAGGVAVALPPLTFTFAVLLARASAAGGGFSWQDLADARPARLHAALLRLREGTGPTPRSGRFGDVGDHEPLFRQQVSRLRAALKRRLGPAAAPYLPVSIGTRPRTRTRFALAPDAIDLVGLPDV